MAKAAVFPVPVWAMAKTSSPAMIEGMALNWMSVVLTNPSRDRFFLMASVMGNFSNFIGYGYFCVLHVSLSTVGNQKTKRCLALHQQDDDTSVYSEHYTGEVLEFSRCSRG